jgi:periplasmic mercuric ion binding protein
METNAIFKLKGMKKLIIYFSFFMILFATLSCERQGKKGEENVNKNAMADQGVQTVTIPVEGMSCSSCVSSVKRKVKSIDGVKQIDVSLEKRQAKISYISEKVSAQTIQEAITSIGYKAGKPIEAKEQ